MSGMFADAFAAMGDKEFESNGRNGWLGGESQDAGSRQRETRWLTPKPIVEALGRFDLDPCGAPGHELAHETYLVDHGQDGTTTTRLSRCHAPADIARPHIS